MNSKKSKNIDLRDTLRKYVEDKVSNVPNKEINIKSLSFFPHTVKLSYIKPGVSLEI